MKYFIAMMIVGAKLIACETCLENMERSLEIMKYYNEFSETEYWKAYTAGTVHGIEMSCKIYNLNHDLAN